MQLHAVDIGIIFAYIIVIVIAGLWLSKLAGKNIESYFLGGKRIPWYLLGIANASGMFDITGTMWLVTLFFIYGLKSTWLPWLWPTFNQVFLMVYLSIWLRRSKVMTGAEWIRTRFGDKLGGKLSHISVLFFAVFLVIGMLAYAFQGIGKFSAVFLPWQLSANTYAIIFMGITTVYVMFGGMYSVVLTDIIQFTLMTIASVFIAVVAFSRTSPEMISAVVPQGWKGLFFDWHLNLDWSNLVPAAGAKIAEDGYSLFGLFFMMMLFKGILASMAGPAPTYDLQKVLSTRSPREGALMSWCTSAALNLPRYLMIAGVGVLGLVFFSGKLNVMSQVGQKVDFEQILPYVISNFLPVGLVGLILAGLIAAFMSTFDATVNCGASYIVNDLYKRYINPSAPAKRYVYMSYACSVAIVVVGILFGYMARSINAVLQWIVAGLWGGFIIPNVLKWHWWRFNGFAYFAGMVGGITTALVFPKLYPLWHPNPPDSVSLLVGFPIILVVSTVSSILVTLLTKPDDENVLKNFYRNVRPWGFWEPVRQMVMRDDPDFRRNTALKRDMVNVVVGTCWQIPLTTIPMFLLIRHYRGMWISIAVLVATSVFLKFNWYDKLEND